MFKKLLSIFFLFSAFTYTVKGQDLVLDYLYSHTVEEFTPLEGDTVFGTGFLDDVLYMGQNNTSGIGCISCSLTGEGFPIGFEFLYEGQPFTRWGFSSNGFIKLGNGTFTMKNSLSTALSSTSDSVAQMNTIYGLHADIMTTANQGSFSYRLAGSAGNRVLIVQFFEFMHYTSSPTLDEKYTFQIKLYEGSNKISISYGNFVKNNIDRTYTVGLKGKFYKDYHSRTISTPPSWSSTARSTTINQTMSMRPDLKPSPGLTYNFIPGFFDNDLSVSALLAPESGFISCPLSNNEVVTIQVKNTGEFPQTAANVGFKANSFPAVVQAVTFTPPLLKDQTRNITMTTPANLSGPGPFALKAFVKLASEIPASQFNDTLTAQITIGRAVETEIVSSLDSLKFNGWKVGRGPLRPAGTYSLWRNSTDFSMFTSSLQMVVDTPLVKNEWLYSPSYILDTSFNYVVSFSAAITDGIFSMDPIASIGDDTVRLAFTNDCGQSWKVLKRFSSQDLLNGNISNELKKFEFVMPPGTSGLTSFAFHGKNNGNAFPDAYRFHFRRFAIAVGPRYDLVADTVFVPSIGNPTCKYSNSEPIHVKFHNNGFLPVDSAIVGFRINQLPPKFKMVVFSPPILYGESRTEIMSGPVGGSFAVPMMYKIRGFIALPNENSQTRFNDTVQSTFVLTQAIPIPTPVYQDYGTLVLNGWKRGRGALIPTGGTSGWGSKSVIPGQATTGVDFGPASGLRQEWVFSNSYRGGSQAQIVFKAAVTSLFDASAIASLNTDTVKVLVSTNCGVSWNVMKSFSNSDLVSSALSNTLTEFKVDFLNPNGSFLVAFAAFRPTTSVVNNGFTFHLDSLNIISTLALDAEAMQFNSPLLSSSVVTGVPLPVKIKIRNSGTSPIAPLTVNAKINDQLFSSEVTNPIAPGAILDVDLGNYTPVGEPFLNVVGWVNLTGDQNMENDTIRMLLTNNKMVSAGKLAFEVFPNPFEQVVTLTGLSPNSSHKINLISLTGKMVFSTQADSNPEGQIQLNDPLLSNLSDGVYFVIVASGNNTAQFKIHKRR